MSSDKEITLVYKTYKNDLQWLYYSLLSIKKFVKGIGEIIIYCHDVCVGELYTLIQTVDIECRIIPVSYDYHGYLKQMVIKASCFKDVKTKYIAIIDSDTVFNVEFNIKNLIEPSGKIVWYYWNNLPQNTEVRVWKESYESMTKTQQNVHYMSNGFPFVFTTESLREAYDKFIELHGVDYNTFCMNGCSKYNIRAGEPIAGPAGRFLDLAKIFEEFEWLGYYCHNFSEDYTFTPTEFSNRTSKLTQFWSHGGLTPDIKRQIETMLHIN